MERVLDNIAQAIAEAVLARLEPHLRVLTTVQPRLLTVQQAAVYLGRKDKAIRHLVASGDLPSVRSDCRVMLDRIDLDKWIDANKTQ